jgi:hypothetical protein
METPGGALAVALAVSQLVYLVAMGALGVRLLLLARRSRQLPELLLSIHFLLCCTVAYLLLATGMAIAQHQGGRPSPTVAWLISSGHGLSVVGVFAGAAFNYLVFRSGVAWARALLAGIGLALIVGYAGYGASGGFSDARFTGGWYALLYGTYMAAAAWVLVEPFLFWTTMRRRLRVGLAEPLEVNRFLLWGIGSLLRFLMLVSGVLPVVLAAERLTAWAPAILTAAAFSGMGVACAYWLTFFPPRAYLARVGRA